MVKVAAPVDLETARAAGWYDQLADGAKFEALQRSFVPGFNAGELRACIAEMKRLQERKDGGVRAELEDKDSPYGVASWEGYLKAQNDAGAAWLNSAMEVALRLPALISEILKSHPEILRDELMSQLDTQIKEGSFLRAFASKVARLAARGYDDKTVVGVLLSRSEVPQRDRDGSRRQDVWGTILEQSQLTERLLIRFEQAKK